MLEAKPMRTRAWRLVSAGLVLALATGVSGGLVERLRFGAADADTLVRVEAELRARFDADAAMLAGVAKRIADGRDGIPAAVVAPGDKGLFDLVTSALPVERSGRVGVTVYDTAGRPIAWAGRDSRVNIRALPGAARSWLTLDPEKGSGVPVIRTSVVDRKARCFTRSCASILRRFWQRRVSAATGGNYRSLSNESSASTCAAAFSPMALLASAAVTVLAKFWSPSRARDAASARRVAGGAWPRWQRTSSTACSAVCRSGNGC